MMLAAMMALSGMALAQGDVCVSIKGDTKVDKGESTCYSDATSKAVAVNGSDAEALFGSHATAINGSDATAIFDTRATAINNSIAEAVFSGSRATAINNSVALANVGGGGGRNEPPCTVTAHNGEVAICP